MCWRIFFLSYLAFLLVIGGKAQAQSDSFRAPEAASQVKGQWSYLGVHFVDVDADRASRLKLNEERGVQVIDVGEGSPADNAGIKPDDVLLSYNGETILGAQQFMRLVRETPPGRKVKIQLWRDGKAQTVVAVIGAFRSSNVFNQLPDSSSPEWRGFKATDVPRMLMTWTNLALGLEYEPIDTQLAQYFGVKRGVLVRSVAKDGAAERAGFKAGDVLISLANRWLTSPEDLRRILHQPGKSMPVLLMRDHKQLSFTITPPPEDQQ